MKTLFRGGTVVSARGKRKLDVLVEDERIRAVDGHIEDSEAHVVDVTGKLIFPGFIDGHTHMDLEVSGTVTADGFETGTRAELAGGTTCLIDFATQNRGETLACALEHWHRKADGKSSCDYTFHLALSDWNEQISRELETVVSQGIRSFKLYMTYDAMAVDDQCLYEILTRLKELGGIAGVHCENRGIIDARLKEVLIKKGHRADTADYPGTRPDLAEAEAVSRLLKIARCVDTPGDRRPFKRAGSLCRDRTGQSRRSDRLCGNLSPVPGHGRRQIWSARRRRPKIHVRSASPEKRRPGYPLAGADAKPDTDRRHRPLQFYAGAESGRKRRFLPDALRDARR